MVLINAAKEFEEATIEEIEAEEKNISSELEKLREEERERRRASTGDGDPSAEGHANGDGDHERIKKPVGEHGEGSQVTTPSRLRVPATLQTPVPGHRIPPIPAKGENIVEAAAVELGTFGGLKASLLKSSVTKLKIVFLMDDSGSMYCKWTDLTGVRYAAARSLRKLLERTGGGQMAVAHWAATCRRSSSSSPSTSTEDGALSIEPFAFRSAWEATTFPSRSRLAGRCSDACPRA